ncbi:MAG TPA: ribose-phosphate pyrophosphokinase, partial [Steroidobacteraceae bacterium]|nr:ribose-phosphate pyrophosphokinase [Steroidobacteraceae bacterium]
KPLIVAMPGNEPMTHALAKALDAEVGQIEFRSFPDGETYLRYLTEVAERTLILVCTLDRPNSKFLPLLFAAATARELFSAKIGLVAPYLAYMRQDRRFNSGEAVTSRQIAHLLSDAFDWLITIDPHLHRYSSLGEIYRIPTQVVHAAPLISEWIKAHVANSFIIGPDSESEQWVSSIARYVGAPYTVLEKTRYGDRNVEIVVGTLDQLNDRTPVLVDDIISSGRTMIEPVRQIKMRKTPAPICIAVHGVFADNSDRLLTQAGARVVTTNSISHDSNEVDVTPALAEGIRKLGLI